MPSCDGTMPVVWCETGRFLEAFTPIAAAMIRYVRQTLLFCLLGLLVVACQQQPVVPAGEPDVVTVEVVREIVVEKTIVATVNVPVEVTREVFVPVTVQPLPAAVEPTATPTVVPVLGSAEFPIRLVFSPVYGEQVTEVRGQALADALSAETGLSFLPIVSATSAEALENACAQPEATVAFLTSLEYVLGNRRCSLQNAYAGVRDGIPWVASMIVTRAPATTEDRVDSLEDLAGKSWAVASTDDLTNFLYYQAVFAERGIEVGPVTTYETDASAVIATFDEREAFVTATYIPPLLPFEERQWVYGVDDPEIWRDSGTMPRRSGIGYVVVDNYVERGGYRVRDARAIALDSRPTIFVYTDLVEVGAQLPNDAVAFGNGMPLGLTREIGAAMERHAQNEACVGSLCSADFFNWEGVAAVDDTFYDSVRFVIDQLSLSDEQVFSYLSR